MHDEKNTGASRPGLWMMLVLAALLAYLIFRPEPAAGRAEAMKHGHLYLDIREASKNNFYSVA